MALNSLVVGPAKFGIKLGYPRPSGGRVARKSRKHPGQQKKMSLLFEETTDPHDPRAVRILAKTIYREVRATGFSSGDVMALAGELLALVTTEVRRETPPGQTR